MMTAECMLSKRLALRILACGFIFPPSAIFVPVILLYFTEKCLHCNQSCELKLTVVFDTGSTTEQSKLKKSRI